MDIDARWYFIAMATIVGLMVVGAAYSENQKKECRIAALEAHMSAQDIQKICE